jgi:hypothetical protein
MVTASRGNEAERQTNAALVRGSLPQTSRHMLNTKAEHRAPVILVHATGIMQRLSVAVAICTKYCKLCMCICECSCGCVRRRVSDCDQVRPCMFDSLRTELPTSCTWASVLSFGSLSTPQLLQYALCGVICRCWCFLLAL